MVVFLAVFHEIPRFACLVAILSVSKNDELLESDARKAILMRFAPWLVSTVADKV